MVFANHNISLIERLVAEFQVTPAQAARLQAHHELLLRWNRVINLTRIEDPQEAIERHYGESLFLASYLPQGLSRIVDIGSGGGFPGVPVAVIRPECSLTLVESHQRKAVFLREATRDLPNVRVIARRAEELEESFDWVIVRAVAWRDIEWVLGKLAPAAAVLSGSGLEADAIKLPWGRQRFLSLFHVKQGKSCFT